MNKAIYDILVCPSCNGKLKMTQDGERLVCTFDKLAYQVNDGIPNMLIDSAEKLSEEKMSKLELR